MIRCTYVPVVAITKSFFVQLLFAVNRLSQVSLQSTGDKYSSDGCVFRFWPNRQYCTREFG